ncbi:MAG: sugar phosphate isomerase/epimerase family protein [Planctomycetota bacterium]
MSAQRDERRRFLQQAILTGTACFGAACAGPAWDGVARSAWRESRTGQASLPAGLTSGGLVAAEPPAPHLRTLPSLGFSLYGMKTWAWADALRELAEIGYRCVELPVMADWPWDSRRWNAAERRAFQQGLERHGLRLSALMENLSLLPTVPANSSPEDVRRLGREQRRVNQERLAAAADLARAWSPQTSTPDSPSPIIETILGGKPADWAQDRQRMVDELGAWAEVVGRQQVVLAIKPHVSGALHRPEDAAWLIEQVQSRWIRATFDYSHYQLRRWKFADCWQTLGPVTSFIHVKDATGDAGKFQFLLPGAGSIDYREYFRAVITSGYRGDVVVEVSGQLHGRPDYDARRAARESFAPLQKALAAVAQS